jgi:glycosyltransferase involved in cell wall biosynthesis
MEFLSDKYVLLLLGREVDGGNIRRTIIEKKLFDRVILTGFCNCLDEFWALADANIFLSKNDGFGLSIIEGYMRGVPTLMYDKLDAVADVNIKEGTVLASELEPQYIATKIEDMMKKSWDADAIVQAAKKYSLECMADKYLNMMREQCETKRN